MVTTRSSRAMEERVEGLEKRMMDHGQMLDYIEETNDMMHHSPRHDHTTEPHQEEEDTASQIANLGGGGQNRGNLRYRGNGRHKLEVPTFDGVDPNGWLVRMDCFFRVSNIPVGEKLNYAVLGLMGEAFTWFEWWEAQSTFHTWLRFKQDLLKRFEPGATLNPLVPLLQVKQTGSVMEYRGDFELAAGSHRNLGGETLLCMFHEGLKPTIKSELDVAEFKSLQALMDRAMVFEARNLAWREEGGSHWEKQHEEDPKSSEGFNRGTNCVRPNNFNSYFERSPPPEPKENQVTHTTRFPASSSSGVKA